MYPGQNGTPDPLNRARGTVAAGGRNRLPSRAKRSPHSGSQGMREGYGRTKRILRTVVLAGLLGGALVSVAQSAPAGGGSEAPPKFTFDGTWPKLPLPNKWTFEGITGLVVDKDDVIWVLQRPGDFDIDPIFRIPEKTENYASLNPPTASCCVKPEARARVRPAGQSAQALEPGRQRRRSPDPRRQRRQYLGRLGHDAQIRPRRKSARDHAARRRARSEGGRLPRRHAA